MRFAVAAVEGLSFLCCSLALGVYGGGSVPVPMQGPARVVRIETEFTCSAVVLNSSILLTASHCTEGMSTSLERIRVINPDTGDRMKARVSRLVRHPQYREGFAEHATIGEVYTDIALLRLSEPLSFPHAGVELARPWDLQNLGQLKIWLVANGSTAKSDTSRNQAIPVTLKSYSSHILESASLMGNSGPCSNDSGGGYFIIEGSQVRLIGIQSSKNENADCGSSNNRGYVVSVPQNLNWILPYLH